MSLQITATNATELGKGLWGVEMPPHQVRLFGSNAVSEGLRSVILIRNCVFNDDVQSLTFNMDDAIALNIGTTSQTIALSATEQPSPNIKQSDYGVAPQFTGGPGDREFLEMSKLLLDRPMLEAAAMLLTRVRERSSGDLKKGKARNFSETPDNFWYVIIQPRVQQLSITVRGSVEHFSSIAKLPIKDDRGNTLFKVTSKSNVPAALEIIFHAIRKK